MSRKASLAKILGPVWGELKPDGVLHPTANSNRLPNIEKNTSPTPGHRLW